MKFADAMQRRTLIFFNLNPKSRTSGLKHDTKQIFLWKWSCVVSSIRFHGATVLVRTSETSRVSAQICLFVNPRKLQETVAPCPFDWSCLGCAAITGRRGRNGRKNSVRTFVLNSAFMGFESKLHKCVTAGLLHVSRHLQRHFDSVWHLLHCTALLS